MSMCVSSLPFEPSNHRTSFFCGCGVASVDFFFLRRTNTSDDVAYSETSVEHHISDSRRRGGLLQVIGHPMNSPTKLAV